MQVAIGLGQFMAAIADWLDEPLRELELMGGLTPARGADLVLSTFTFTSVPAVLDVAPAAVGAVHDPSRVWRFRVATHASSPRLPANRGDPAAPLVYVTFGSVAGSLGDFGELYQAVLDVLAALPVRVLMTTGTGFNLAQVHPVPPNAWAVQWWPQDAAMSESALVVGHGGFGTTMTALSAGVPQIVMPLFALDQFLNAERVQAVGAGVQLPGGLDNVSELPGAVLELLGQGRFAAVARAVATEITALPDVATTVEILQELAR